MQSALLEPLRRPAIEPPSCAAAPRPDRRPPHRPQTPTLEAVWARHADEVQQAQRLRHRVFMEELGACPGRLPGAPSTLDVDAFDAHCEHLLVRAQDGSGGPSIVVGTYRVLMPTGARALGRLYSEGEFDLSPLAHMRGHMVELGRSCVDPAFRHGGGVILLLWRKLAELMTDNRLRWMVGCASVSVRDGGHQAASLWEGLRQGFLADEALRVRPLQPLPLLGIRTDLKVEPPALIKGYLRCGARLLGPPAWDPSFGCADLPMLLDLEGLDPAYRRRFLAPGLPPAA